MRILRIISIFLVCVFMSNVFTFATASEITTEPMDIVIHDSEKNDQINNLLVLRRELELDYVTNEARINQIDQMLSELGVESVSSDTVLTKLGGAVPAIDLPTDDDIRWTSRRLVVTYYGQHYELQILEAMPLGTNSCLIDDDAACVYEAQGITAGIANALKVIGVSSMGAVTDIPSVPDEIKYGITILDAFLTADEIVDGFRDSLSTSTVFEEVSGTALISFTTHMQYIFVKHYQAADYGNQALCYVGSSVSFKLTTTSAVWTESNDEDSDPVVEHVVYTHDSTVYSPYYDVYSLPAKNYHHYFYSGTNYNCWYYLRSITLNIFENEVTFSVPYEHRFS